MQNEKVKNDDELEFKPLSFFREFFLPEEKLADYYRKKREYEYNNGTNIKGLGWRDKLHPILLKLFSLSRSLINKQTLTIINDKREKNNDKPVIYAITHIGMYDLQIVSEAIRNHQYTFAGDPETMYRSSDGFFLNLNGLVYCDTESKTDRYIAQQTATQLLKNGQNLMLYPEGVWNLSSNLLMLPLFPGIIKIAQETGCDIVPVAIEQYDNDFIVNIGSNFKVGNELLYEQSDKTYIESKKEELRNILATLKWEIIESRPKIKRSELGTYDDEANKFIDTRLLEWLNPKTKKPYYTREIVKKRTFRPKGVVFSEEAFSYFNKIKLNKNNAFIFRNDPSLPNCIQDTIENELNNYNNLYEETNCNNKIR